MIDLTNIVAFPVKLKDQSVTGVEAYLRGESRSATLIKSLDAVLDNMMSARGEAWTQAILDAAWARQMERLEIANVAD